MTVLDGNLYSLACLHFTLVYVYALYHLPTLPIRCIILATVTHDCVQIHPEVLIKRKV